MQAYSFTTTFNGLSNVLYNDCHVSLWEQGKQTKMHPFKAIWDTGATASVISRAVVDTCQLKPIGFGKVYHAQGESTTEVYVVSIKLPNGVLISPVRVTRGVLKDTDVLIGMDIISKGDFAVTNRGNRTRFSFRIPSRADIDFVSEDRHVNARRQKLIYSRSKAQANNRAQKSKRRGKRNRKR